MPATFLANPIVIDLVKKENHEVSPYACGPSSLYDPNILLATMFCTTNEIDSIEFSSSGKAATQVFPNNLGKPKVHYHTHKALHWFLS
jgi:hypothetical protein